jgi:predicted PurR-regulated permease PerM
MPQRGLSAYLVSLNRRLRLLIVIILAAAAVLGVIWWGGTLVVSEARSLAREMHGLFRHAEEVLRTESHAWFPPGANPMKPSPDVGVVVAGAATVVRKLFEVVIFFGIAMFVGAFCAWEPQAYKQVILSLLPRQRRARVREVTDRSADAMRGWLCRRTVCQ